MICPNCGTQDQSGNQFCRSCGLALHAVRSAIEKPDAITTSAVTAREEIGRAIAGKIAEFQNLSDLRRAVYEILPVVEGFLESPEERRLKEQRQRLNQIREGVLTSVVGLAIMLSFLLISWITQQEKILIVSAGGLLVLLVGLGITITAVWFTAPKGVAAPGTRTSQLKTDEKLGIFVEKERTALNSKFHSVTEGTTRELR